MFYLDLIPPLKIRVHTKPRLGPLLNPLPSSVDESLCGDEEQLKDTTGMVMMMADPMRRTILGGVAV